MCAAGVSLEEKLENFQVNWKDVNKLINKLYNS